MASLFISSLLPMLGEGLYVNLSLPVLLLIILIALTGPGGDVAYTRAIQMLGGSLAAVISQSYIFFAQLFSAALVGESLTPSSIASSVLAFTGIVIAVRGNDRSSMNKGGVLLALLAATSWGFSAVLVKYIQPHIDAISSTLLRLLAASVLLLPISRLSGEKFRLTRGLIITAAITGILSWGVGLTLATLSIYMAGVTSTVIATALTPVLSQVTTTLLARERLSRRVIAGAVLVSLGIVVKAI